MDKNNKFFQSTEELVSMFLGLLIVLIAGALIFNYFQKQSGNVDLAGLTDTPTVTEEPKTTGQQLSPTVVPTSKSVAQATLAPTKKPESTPTNVPTKKAEATMTLAPTEKPQAVKLPESAKTVEPKDGEYIVKKGDTLWKIAMANYGSGYNWVDIAKENKLKSPGNIKVGQKLNLPKNVVKKEVVVNADKPKITIESDNYTVVKGDSLSNIALRAYGDSYAWTKIYKANQTKISNPSLIYAGTQLVIPREKGNVIK